MALNIFRGIARLALIALLALFFLSNFVLIILSAISLARTSSQLGRVCRWQLDQWPVRPTPDNEDADWFERHCFSSRAFAYLLLLLASIIAWITTGIMLFHSLLRPNRLGRWYFLRGLILTLLIYLPAFVFGWFVRSRPFEHDTEPRGFGVRNGTVIFAHIAFLLGTLAAAIAAVTNTRRDRDRDNRDQNLSLRSDPKPNNNQA